MSLIDTPPPDTREGADDPPSILVVADFPEKIGRTERHVKPLAASADVTMVCIEPTEDVPDVAFASVPSTGIRPLDLLLMFARALLEGVRDDYDGVASFSLFPHGCFALVVGRLCGVPTHLGIIGIDLDVHAKAWYGSVTVALLRRFDAVSVPGTVYARELAELGVPARTVERLVNPIPETGYDPVPPTAEKAYDYLWVGRFAPEKDPVLFVETVAELVDDDPDATAVMLGDGRLRPEVERAIADRGLSDNVHLAGWVDDPRAYYADARVLVLTSRRDALPLTLLEAMTSGVVCVAPTVGNVPDLIDDGRNGLLVPNPTPSEFARAAKRLEREPGLYERLARAAPEISDEFSPETAAEDWRSILVTMGVTEADVHARDSALDTGREPHNGPVTPATTETNITNE